MITPGVTLRTTASVNGGPWLKADVRYSREDVRVRDADALRPDLGWLYRDREGHRHWFHADDVNGNGGGDHLPTLTAYTVHEPCDGSCGDICGGEGYVLTRYRCRLCGDDVQPRYVPDDYARVVGMLVPGITSVEVTTYDSFAGVLPTQMQWFDEDFEVAYRVPVSYETVRTSNDVAAPNVVRERTRFGAAVDVTYETRTATGRLLTTNVTTSVTDVVVVTATYQIRDEGREDARHE